MNQIDLNLDNYELRDLLALFKLNMNFNENDLKEAKKIVHLVHPDKSGLDSKYFIFYKKAYDLLSQIYYINHGNKNSKVTNVSYDTISSDYYNSDKNKAVQQLQKSSQFNKHFNQLFDEYYVKKDDGYGDWMKQEDESVSYNDLKKQSRELALRTSIKELTPKSNFTELGGSSSYSSDQYMDLREAYTTGCVIGVDEQLDFEKVKKYNSLNELQNERAMPIKPLSQTESIHILNKQDEEENIQSIQRIYNLTKERETHLHKQNSFWSKFLSIKF